MRSTVWSAVGDGPPVTKSMPRSSQMPVSPARAAAFTSLSSMSPTLTACAGSVRIHAAGGGVGDGLGRAELGRGQDGFEVLEEAEPGELGALLLGVPVGENSQPRPSGKPFQGLQAWLDIGIAPPGLLEHGEVALGDPGVQKAGTFRNRLAEHRQERTEPASVVLSEGAETVQVFAHVARLQRPPQRHQLLRWSRRVRRGSDDLADRFQDRASMIDQGAVQVEEDHICHEVIIPWCLSPTPEGR